LVNGFIGHLYTQLGTTSNYSVIANLHTIQITKACAKSFSACCVLTNRSLMTASNSEYSSASRAQVILSLTPVQNSLSIFNSSVAPSLLSLSCRAQLNCQTSTDSNAPVLFCIITSHGPHRKHCSSIVACAFLSAGTCLPSRCLETAVCLFVCCIATAVLVVCLATGLYATISWGRL
jgi:hypothetical protein